MKKYFLIVLSIFLTALMPACAQTQRDPYKIYVAGYSDSISKANHSLEIDLSNEITYKGSVKKTKTVNVFGRIDWHTQLNTACADGIANVGIALRHTFYDITFGRGCKT